MQFEVGDTLVLHRTVTKIWTNNSTGRINYQFGEDYSAMILDDLVDVIKKPWVPAVGDVVRLDRDSSIQITYKILAISDKKCWIRDTSGFDCLATVDQLKKVC